MKLFIPAFRILDNSIIMGAFTVKKDEKKSKINTDDGWNRTVFGSPTIGGFIVFGLIVIYIGYQWIFG